MYENIFNLKTPEEFEKRSIDTFHHQYNYNPIYRKYVKLLDIDPSDIRTLAQIPFLPIRFFKTQTILTAADPAASAEKIFTSSATSGMTPSKHYILDLKLYEESFLRSFTHFYGAPSDYVIIALLPSYLEREGSSLIYMADRLIKESSHPESGYYLYNHEDLYKTLCALGANHRKTLLLGVTFALLDFAEKFHLDPDLTNGKSSLIIMETGGMKGRGEELPREEVHSRLKASFGVSEIHSEYGMCELLSQAYSAGNGLFSTPPWMRILLRDFTDFTRIISPSDICADGANKSRNGAINIIDLANQNSCSFIETDDRGTLFQDGTFTIDGRLSNADRRGCNMLVE